MTLLLIRPAYSNVGISNMYLVTLLALVPLALHQKSQLSIADLMTGRMTELPSLTVSSVLGATDPLPGFTGSEVVSWRNAKMCRKRHQCHRDLSISPPLFVVSMELEPTNRCHIVFPRFRRMITCHAGFSVGPLIEIGT